MPIFDYVCSACAERFEQLVNADTLVQCPACAATEVQKQLSAPAIGAAKAPAMPRGGPCGTCPNPLGGGACGLS